MAGSVVALLLIGSGLQAAKSADAKLVRFGGGPLYADQPSDCIVPAEREAVRKDIARFQAATRGGSGVQPFTPAPQKYRFFPQGGTLWRDLFVVNFADKDPTAGILDWDCTDFTYDTHAGHDVDLKTFGEQVIGVPIFAVLDGVVVARADGNFDQNTSWGGQPANYVVLYHGGTHYTYYWHMRNGSVAVNVGDYVKAGTQLGMTASSGNSSGPHLHFETWNNNTWIEPSSGACNNDESNWTNQTPIRRDMYLRDFNITNVLIENYPGLPTDMPRTGTFLSGVRPVSWWMNLHNQPAFSTWRVVLRRPNGTVNYDSATVGFNNGAPYRWAWWWWRYNFNLDMVGNWSVEIYLNGTLSVAAPFSVVASQAEIVNRRPNPITGGLDPANPRPGDVVFCRVNSDLVLDDPDYDIVRYRYRWFRNGVLVRDVVSAGLADALPGSKLPVSSLRCEVLVGDGKGWDRGFVAVPVGRS
jgi:murein DD-endopeptidase MepM/ murein hydrolase activator NlpD